MIDEALNQRFRNALGTTRGVVEKRMMGGTCFMLNGNMLGGADRQKKTDQARFMFRVGKDNYDQALTRSGAMPMEMGGRRMSGFVFVEAQACNAKELKRWIALARKFVDTLPAK